MTYKNCGQLSRDNSMEHIPRFHTPQMGNTFGRKVEHIKKLLICSNRWCNIVTKKERVLKTQPIDCLQRT
jgi:hypothetical protein